MKALKRGTTIVNAFNTCKGCYGQNRVTLWDSDGVLAWHDIKNIGFKGQGSNHKIEFVTRISNETNPVVKRP